jgi:hypothetical protein
VGALHCSLFVPEVTITGRPTDLTDAASVAWLADRQQSFARVAAELRQEFRKLLARYISPRIRRGQF